MVINTSYHTQGNVRFISYSGEYPNLCSGELTLEIEGKKYKFGGYDPHNYPRFWESGGCCYCRAGQTKTGEWQIDCSDLPSSLQKYVYEIDEVFNANVTWGCCGGCI